MLEEEDKKKKGKKRGLLASTCNTFLQPRCLFFKLLIEMSTFALSHRAEEGIPILEQEGTTTHSQKTCRIKT
jgi:hypothetical protein